MPTYDNINFNPPAPLARITLRNPQNGMVINDVPMILDTGADATLLPKSFVEQLGVSEEANTVYELEGFDSNRSFAIAIYLEMLFLDKTFRGKFLLLEQNYGVIGRNILNLLTITFDGPALTWREGE